MTTARDALVRVLDELVTVEVLSLFDGKRSTTKARIANPGALADRLLAALADRLLAALADDEATVERMARTIHDAALTPWVGTRWDRAVRLARAALAALRPAGEAS